MVKKKFYITTAIDYVNAEPHIGHAFEKVLADAIARWKKLRGYNVWFLTGTDENAQKNEQAAKAAGQDTKKFVDKNAAVFVELCKKLDISNNDFIRTTEARHVKFAQELFKQLVENGDIYKGKYEGYYCTGCEAFITQKDLVNEKCPEHDKKPVWMHEDAYFFKLSKYLSQVSKFVRESVIPEEKKNEILSRLKEQDLKDLCVSRAGLTWGIDSPIDKKFKIYVWIDALSNYISALGTKESELWPANVHVIGKGINWFHSVIWPAILLSAGYKLPEKILVHGYLNLGGEKMSKSKGNVLSPIPLVNKYGVDALRYSLLRCSVFEDSDYSEEILAERNNELANKLGNLVSRVAALAEKYGLEQSKNSIISKELVSSVEKHMDNFETDKALGEIFAQVDRCNEYIQGKKPWETKDKQVLYELVDSIKTLTILLYPFIPSSCEKIAEQFSFKINWNNIEKPIKPTKIKKSEILFKKI